MIEINQKAKQADPWDTPPITDVALFRQYLNEGRHMAIFITNGDGSWEVYDKYRPIWKHSDEQIKEKWLSRPDRYQLRVHAHYLVMVSLKYIAFSEFWPDKCHLQTLTAPTLAKAEARLQHLKDDGKVIQSYPAEWEIIRVEGKKFSYVVS